MKYSFKSLFINLGISIFSILVTTIITHLIFDTTMIVCFGISVLTFLFWALPFCSIASIMENMNKIFHKLRLQDKANYRGLKKANYNKSTYRRRR